MTAYIITTVCVFFFSGLTKIVLNKTISRLVALDAILCFGLGAWGIVLALQ